MKKVCDLCKREREGKEHFEEPLEKIVFWCFECIEGVIDKGYFFKPLGVKDAF